MTQTDNFNVIHYYFIFVIHYIFNQGYNKHNAAKMHLFFYPLLKLLIVRPNFLDCYR